MNRKDRRRAEAQRRQMDVQSVPHDSKDIKVVLDQMDIQSMLHNNKDIKLVLDASSTKPIGSIEPLEIEGVMSEDAVLTTLEGKPVIRLIARCGELSIFGMMVSPKEPAAILDHCKKDVPVRLVGMFQPTLFERHEGTDLLKPYGGIMGITRCACKKRRA